MNRRAFRSMSVFGLVTLLSRITGLLREMVNTRMIPTTNGVMDAFLVAYMIPNFLRRLFAEGAFSQAFVPVVSEYRARRTPEEVRELVDCVAGTLGLFLAVVSLIAVLIAPLLIWVFAPGFSHDAGKFALAAEMLRWTFPYLLFVSLTALAGGVLNSYDRFALPAFSSVLLNVIMIAFAAWVSPHVANPGLALAIGVFVAGIVQVMVQLPPLLKMGLVRRPHWNFKHEGVRRIGRLMLPAIVGSSMGQLSVMLSGEIASFLASGSIAWLYYADRLVEFPLGVFSIALATVILPSLSAHHSQDSPEQFTATLDWALRMLCVVVIPASVALFVLAGPLTTVIFHGGKFTALDVQMTTWAVMAYALALFGWSLVKVLAPGYFARQDTKTPVRTAMQSFGLTMALNIVAIVTLKWLGRTGDLGAHVLLALATAAGALLNAWLLYRGLRKQAVYHPTKGWSVLLLQILVANVVMGTFLYLYAGDTIQWVQMASSKRVLRLAELIAAGGALYFVSLWLVGMRPKHFKH
jgi:putative peptidoglycan lipid II flippase